MPVARALFSLLLAFAFVAIAAGTARAQDTRRAGTVRLEAASGGRGPIDLAPAKGGYSAELVIANDGEGPLVVSRIAVRGDASDPRAPPNVSARLVDGSLPVTVAPGASRRAVVTWAPDRGARQRQVFAHVVVTTSDERSGDVAMGVRARLSGVRGWLESRALSLLVGVPLLGAIASLSARAAGRRDDRAPYVLTSFALAIQTSLAAYVLYAFTPDVSRADGNDGLQFIVRAIWSRGLSTELYLGVDGVAAIALLVISASLFCAVLSERSALCRVPDYHAALLVLDAAVMGALTAMDGLLFLLLSSIAVLSAGLLVGTWGGAGRRAAATRLLASGLMAIVLLAVALVATARHADATLLVDGTSVTTTFSLPELSRVALGAKGATFLGVAHAKVCFVMLLAAALSLLAAFPAHGWLGDVLVEAPPATGILVAAALPAIGLSALVRIGCAVLPEGMRWASGVVVALGAVSAAYGAFAALGQPDLRRLAACATTCQAGFVLLGAGSLTPQGLAGAIAVGATRALACGAFLLAAAAIHERARTSDVPRLGGVAAQMPRWAIALAAAGFAQAGAFGLGGAWGPLLALLGALASYAPLALAAAIGLVVMTAAHLIVMSRVTFGPLDPAWRRSALLEPHGGRFPDLTRRETTSVAPLVVVVIVLGVWPRPVVSATTGTVRDLANAVSPPGPDQVALR